MPKAKLTKTYVDNLKPEDKDVRYFDTELTGFHVKVTPKGKKAFGVKGVIPQTNKPKWISLGTYPAITVAQARDMAQIRLGELAQGIDPITVKKQAKIESVTLEQAYKEFCNIRKLKSSTLEDYSRSLNMLGWGGSQWHKITGDMVLKKHEELTLHNGDAAANLAMRFLQSLINFCIGRYRAEGDKPMIAENPVQRLSDLNAWNKVSCRTNFIAKENLKDWWEACEQLQEPVTRDYIKFVLLTGLRREEAAGLRWIDVDMKTKTFSIPDTKNGLTHTLPLTDYLLTLIEARRASKINDFVFPSTKSKTGHIVEPKRAYNRIEQISGVKTNIHDLRRTFITIAESLDIPAYALKGLLNHKSGNDVTQSYIQITPERLREPMQAITDYILKQVGVKQSAQIIEFPLNESA